MSNTKKPILKSQKTVSLLAGALAALCFSTGLFFIDQIENNQIAIESVVSSSVDLSSSTYAKAHAQKLGVLDVMAKDANGDIIRFEALQGKPIDIIVDENSMWSMTDNVKSAIKLAIAQYNELFSYINPDYSFRYISKEEYEKNTTSDPFMYITTNLRINTKGGTARAVTSPADAVTSKFDNGAVDSSSTIIISSTGTIHMTAEQIANVIIHEMAHALGFEKHVENKDSIMHPTSDGATIASNYFSEDILKVLLSSYYNPQTNPKPFSEIMDYCKNHINNRNLELQKYYETKNVEINKEQTETKESLEEQTEAKESKEVQNLNKYISSVKDYAKKNKLSAGKINNIVGKTYIETTIYGQTKTLSFFEDGTYTLEIADAERYLKCTGIYEIINNTAVLKGEYYTVENMKYVPIQDTIYVSPLSNGGCLLSSVTNNFVVVSTYSESLENELSH